jgi:hypothetical protein
MEVTKKDLEKAVDELNDKIADPPIKKKDEKKMKKKILQAAKLIEADDNISGSTMSTIKALKKSSKPKLKSKAPKGKASKSNKKVSGGKKVGIGAYVVENLKNGEFNKLSNAEIVGAVKKKFPEANTKEASIAWYKAKVNSGEL